MEIRKAKSDMEKITIVVLSQREAVQMIKSLADQIIGKNCNSGRLELRDGNQYFSVAVKAE